MESLLERIIVLGIPINNYYSAPPKEQARLKPRLMADCELLLKQLTQKVPAFKLRKDDELEWSRACFHLFGEFVQLNFTNKEYLLAAVAAMLSFLKNSDDGEDFAPYQTLVKLYSALGDTDNAYQIVSNTKKAFGDEPFFAEILKSAPYKAWSKQQKQ
ncbi:hypothetical protein JY651_47835 [Pyxidicoccus parkwayensis]|uniref:Tetratricopeptide repeat protein n=1 Tax=Pyxidicoccus parkwayensis TaxID=2813578 RepID=A0ABX7NWD0_9BACT|nr:hypothetical protein [Pyxidicoccus parkwaysis]QSQ22731.1 hypothetical protein JY651_47835 [Pyxidicoccus parkwaysis]